MRHHSPARRAPRHAFCAAMGTTHRLTAWRTGAQPRRAHNPPAQAGAPRSGAIREAGLALPCYSGSGVQVTLAAGFDHGLWRAPAIRPDRKATQVRADIVRRPGSRHCWSRSRCPRAHTTASQYPPRAAPVLVIVSNTPSDDLGDADSNPHREHAATARTVEGDGAARRVAERERDAAEASRDRFAFMAEVSRCLAASLDYETTLATVAGMSLPYLGAWCIVDVCIGDHGIRRLAVLHPHPVKQEIARTLHERYPPHADDLLGAPRVIRTGRPEVVLDASDAALSATAQDAEHLQLLRELGISAYVIAPMVARGRVVGAMTFVTVESGRRFGDLDLLLAEDLASRAALAVDNARLHTEALQAREKAAEAQAVAEAASRAKSEFLAVMSHELRTPLNAITGYVDLIEMGLRGPVTPEQRADLARIHRSERHLMGLINGVLNYSRLEAGAVHYEVQDVAIDQVLATCEALVAPQASAKRLAMTFNECDPTLM